MTPSLPLPCKLPLDLTRAFDAATTPDAGLATGKTFTLEAAPRTEAFHAFLGLFPATEEEARVVTLTVVQAPQARPGDRVEIVARGLSDVVGEGEVRVLLEKLGTAVRIASVRLTRASGGELLRLPAPRAPGAPGAVLAVWPLATAWHGESGQIHVHAEVSAAALGLDAPGPDATVGVATGPCPLCGHAAAAAAAGTVPVTLRTDAAGTWIIRVRGTDLPLTALASRFGVPGITGAAPSMLASFAELDAAGPVSEIAIGVSPVDGHVRSLHATVTKETGPAPLIDGHGFYGSSTEVGVVEHGVFGWQLEVTREGMVVWGDHVPFRLTNRRLRGAPGWTLRSVRPEIPLGDAQRWIKVLPEWARAKASEARFEALTLGLSPDRQHIASLWGSLGARVDYEAGKGEIRFNAAHLEVRLVAHDPFKDGERVRAELTSSATYTLRDGNPRTLAAVGTAADGAWELRCEWPGQLSLTELQSDLGGYYYDTEIRLDHPSLVVGSSGTNVGFRIESRVIVGMRDETPGLPDDMPWEMKAKTKRTGAVRTEFGSDNCRVAPHPGYIALSRDGAGEWGFALYVGVSLVWQSGLEIENAHLEIALLPKVGDIPAETRVNLGGSLVFHPQEEVYQPTPAGDGSIQPVVMRKLPPVLDLSGEYQKVGEKSGFEFTGSLRNVSLAAFAAKIGLVDVPKNFPDIVITELTALLNTRTKARSFVGKATVSAFEVDGQRRVRNATFEVRAANESGRKADKSTFFEAYPRATGDVLVLKGDGDLETANPNDRTTQKVAIVVYLDGAKISFLVRVDEVEIELCGRRAGGLFRRIEDASAARKTKKEKKEKEAKEKEAKKAKEAKDAKEAAEAKEKAVADVARLPEGPERTKAHEARLQKEEKERKAAEKAAKKAEEEKKEKGEEEDEPDAVATAFDDASEAAQEYLGTLLDKALGGPPEFRDIGLYYRTRRGPELRLDTSWTDNSGISAGVTWIGADKHRLDDDTLGRALRAFAWAGSAELVYTVPPSPKNAWTVLVGPLRLPGLTVALDMDIRGTFLQKLFPDTHALAMSLNDTFPVPFVQRLNQKEYEARLKEDDTAPRFNEFNEGGVFDQDGDNPVKVKTLEELEAAKEKIVVQKEKAPVDGRSRIDTTVELGPLAIREISFKADLSPAKGTRPTVSVMADVALQFGVYVGVAVRQLWIEASLDEAPGKEGYSAALLSKLKFDYKAEGAAATISYPKVVELSAGLLYTEGERTATGARKRTLTGVGRVRLFDSLKVAALAHVDLLDDKVESIFAFGVLGGVRIGPSYLQLTGLIGGYSKDYVLKMPKTPQEVKASPIFVLTKGHQSAEVLTTALRDYRKALTHVPGAWGVAFGATFIIAQKLNCANMVVVQSQGEDLDISLIGLAEGELGEKGDAGFIQFALLGRFSTRDKTIQIIGALTEETWVFSKACKLHGGFALCVWYGGPYSGDWLLSLGGYSPLATKRPHYPALDRVGISWQIRPNLSLYGHVYLAVDRYSFAIGCAAGISFKTDEFTVQASLTFDALCEWSPLFYEIDLRILVRIEVHYIIHVRLGLDVQAHVWGPPFGVHLHVKLQLGLYNPKFDIDLGGNYEEANKNRRIGLPQMLDNVAGAGKPLMQVRAGGAPVDYGEVESKPPARDLTMVFAGSGADSFRPGEVDLVVSASVPLRKVYFRGAQDLVTGEQATDLLDLRPCVTRAAESSLFWQLRQGGKTPVGAGWRVETTIERVVENLWSMKDAAGAVSERKLITSVRIRPPEFVSEPSRTVQKLQMADIGANGQTSPHSVVTSRTPTPAATPGPEKVPALGVPDLAALAALGFDLADCSATGAFRPLEARVRQSGNPPSPEAGT